MHGMQCQRVSNLVTRIFTINCAEDWRQLHFKSNTLMVTEHIQVISSVLVTLPSVKESLIRERFEPTLSCSDNASQFPAKQLYQTIYFHTFVTTFTLKTLWQHRMGDDYKYNSYTLFFQILNLLIHNLKAYTWSFQIRLHFWIILPPQWLELRTQNEVL